MNAIDAICRKCGAEFRWLAVTPMLCAACLHRQSGPAPAQNASEEMQPILGFTLRVEVFGVEPVEGERTHGNT